MGCELGKLASSGDSKKDVDNNVNEPPAPSAPDSRLPLTARQKYSMVSENSVLNNPDCATLKVNQFQRRNLLFTGRFVEGNQSCHGDHGHQHVY